MKLDHKKLYKALVACSKNIGKNPILPIIEYIYMKYSDGRVQLISTNLESYYHIYYIDDNELAGDFETLIPLKFLNIIKSCEELKIEVTKFGSTITTEKISVSFNGGEVDKFPALPNEDFRFAVEADHELLEELLIQSKFTTSDEMRPAMTGVFVSCSDETPDDPVVVVASDGHVLKRKKFSHYTSKTKFGFIIHRKQCMKFKEFLSGVFSVMIAVSNKYVRFNFKKGDYDYTIYHRKIDTTYPDFNAVINGCQTPNSFTINKSMFEKEIKSVMPFSNKTTQQVKIDLIDDKITTTDHESVFGEYSSKIKILNKDGEYCIASFRANYLLKFLEGLKEKQVTMKYLNANKPFIATEGDKEDNLLLIMPVIIY